jgi:hypothetical protein
MLKRLSLLAVAAAFSLAMCWVPVNVASAAQQAGPGMQQQPGMGQQQPNSPGNGSQMPQQQMPPMGEQQPTTSHQAHQKAQTLNGKIAVQNGHYVFKNTSNNTTLRVSNPKKVKKYAGDNVQIKGKVNEQAQTVHVSKVKVVS